MTPQVETGSGAAALGEPSQPLVFKGLVKWHLIAAMSALGVAMLAGVFYSLQLLQARRGA